MREILCNDVWEMEDEIVKKYNRYKTLIYQLAIFYTGNVSDSEDIIQESLIRLCYHAPKFESEEDEKRWLVRVTINLCKNYRKSFWNRNKVSMDELEHLFTKKEEVSIMSEIIQLPEKYKTVLLLHYIYGYKIKEISALIGISESAVKMRSQRGKERLKVILEVE